MPRARSRSSRTASSRPCSTSASCAATSGSSARQLLGERHLDLERDQLLLRAVVEVALDAPALGVAGGHGPGAATRPARRSSIWRLEREQHRLARRADELRVGVQRRVVPDRRDRLAVAGRRGSSRARRRRPPTRRRGRASPRSRAVDPEHELDGGIVERRRRRSPAAAPRSGCRRSRRSAASTRRRRTGSPARSRAGTRTAAASGRPRSVQPASDSVSGSRWRTPAANPWNPRIGIVRTSAGT